MSLQERMELQIEYMERGKPPTPNAERLQMAKEGFVHRFFLNKLINCTGQWEPRYSKDYRRAQSEGRDGLEQRYVLSGQWVKVKEFDQKITRRDLKQKGLKGIIGSEPEGGLYWFLEMIQADLPKPYNGYYYESIWSALLETVSLNDPSTSVVQTLKQKPKLCLNDSLLPRNP